MSEIGSIADGHNYPAT